MYAHFTYISRYEYCAFVVIGAFHSILHVTEGKIRGKQSALLSNSQHSVNSELILELSTKPSSYMKTFIMFDKIL